MYHLKGFVPGFVGLLLCSFTSLTGQGYQIEISVEGLSGDTIMLGEYFTTRMVPKDTLILDDKGAGIFEGEEPFAGGLYLIFYQSGYYFDFLLGDDQHFSIKADTSDMAGRLSFRGSEDNQLFEEYKKELHQKRSELGIHQASLENAANESDSTRIRDEINRINGEMESYMNNIGKDNSHLLFGKFIGATREPVPQVSLLNGDRRHDDSIRFFYYKNHFFEHFDPFDVRMLHTPLYEGKIKNYLARAVTQHPDSIILAVDFLLEGSKPIEELYRYMLITLFNHYAESKFMGMDVVYFHIAEHYYIPDATWSSKEFLTKLKENLDNNKPTLIGQRAPNLIMRKVPPEHFEMAALDTVIKRDPHIGENFFINEIDARFTILYFWEADCAHCKETTPVLHDVYTRLKDKGVEVIAVHAINTVKGKESWVDFINENQMYDWINCWSPYSNEFRKLYNLQSYPQLLVLDREKKIVAKRVTPEQAEQIINNLIKFQS